MNKLIFACVLIIAAISNSFACDCDGPNFDDEGRLSALHRFMNTKLDTPTFKIVSIKAEALRDYLTTTQKALLLFSSDSCEIQCEKKMNTDQDFKIVFKQDDETCSVNLRLVMTSNRKNDGFKTKVIQKYAPVCE